jgi:uncharacterized protein YbjT (DUF2867 family)
MTRKTATVFAATGTAGRACVEEVIGLQKFNVQVLARRSGQAEKSTSGVARDGGDKQRLYARWRESGVGIKEVDATNHAELIPALQGTDYLVSCVPTGSTESQYPLIWAAKEAGVERSAPLPLALLLTNQFTRGPATQRMHCAPWRKLRWLACSIAQALLPTSSACPR